MRISAPATLDVEIDEDDDEETLQLKLQELQARLKLKKLRAAKAVEEQQPVTGGRSSVLERSHTMQRMAAGGDENLRPEQQSAVQVPASPTRKLQPPIEAAGRKKVSLDKGFQPIERTHSRAAAPARLASAHPQPAQAASAPQHFASPSRGLTFSERLAAARTKEIEQDERAKKIQLSRNKSFGIGKEEMEQFKSKAVEIPEEAPKPTVFSREEVMAAEWKESGMRKSKTAPNLASSSADGTGKAENEDGGSFETYSSLHLAQRILPHTVLARHVSGKKIMNVKDLLRDVKAPDFALPDVEQDIVCFGIVARKSAPRDHKPGPDKSQDRGKYMVMTLCDLEWELDLFLFNTGFDRFWKLTEGTLVAILNPNVMPPMRGKQDTGRFSLVINSDEDTILEIGRARDMHYCEALRKDGDPCGAWVNKRRTKFCEYHVNAVVDKTKLKRFEMNTGSGFGSGPKKKGTSSMDKMEKWQKKVGWVSKEEYFASKAPKNYDWETKTRFYTRQSMTAADLLDGKDLTNTDRKEKEAHLQRNLLAREKEREIQAKLARTGTGAGRDYMERAVAARSKTKASQESAKPSAPSNILPRPPGLPERKINLGTTKRKRPDSTNAGSVSSSTLGWGNELKGKLSKMRDGEKLHPDSDQQPPVRKKTRFVTEKGIREAGRESLGGSGFQGREVAFDDDDGDELVIVG
ncbi:cell division cycle protein [Emericellopsis cladophorae]|uniref:Cell division cycle protein n=1 Tax=Emericellopsis cladophorae TaxID=2686198 RepID=A0A9P9Y650_9HYPO|nr:cell division cycle protein [Emericellopsis cladophorae]KAI6784239.1 cell division cycle protein [Emericellopsis cladophorae]